MANEIRRGSTPTHVFTSDIDLAGADVYVTYEQNGRTIIEKTGDALTVSGGRIEVALSQADTLALSNVRKARMQIRYVFPDGRAGASNIITASVGELLKEGEISYGI